jgi:hypothetical protein
MDTFLWYVLLGVVYAVLSLLVIVCSCVDKHVRAVAQAQVPAGAAGGGAAAVGQESSSLLLEPLQEGRRRRSPLELRVREGHRRGRRSFRPEPQSEGRHDDLRPL